VTFPGDSLVVDIPAGDGKIANLFCNVVNSTPTFEHIIVHLFLNKETAWRTDPSWCSFLCSVARGRGTVSASGKNILF
jgi:hypothetical protein